MKQSCGKRRFDHEGNAGGLGVPAGQGVQGAGLGGEAGEPVGDGVGGVVGGGAGAGGSVGRWKRGGRRWKEGLEPPPLLGNKDSENTEQRANN